MESIAIIKIKLTGIIGCLKQYTSEPTIKSIIDSLQSAMIENDFDIVLFACKEIDEWYKKNISRAVNEYFCNIAKQNRKMVFDWKCIS